jgi:hypothetical protein
MSVAEDWLSFASRSRENWASGRLLKIVGGFSEALYTPKMILDTPLIKEESETSMIIVSNPEMVGSEKELIFSAG